MREVGRGVGWREEKDPVKGDDSPDLPLKGSSFSSSRSHLIQVDRGSNMTESRPALGETIPELHLRPAESSWVTPSKTSETSTTSPRVASPTSIDPKVFPRPRDAPRGDLVGTGPLLSTRTLWKG